MALGQGSNKQLRAKRQTEKGTMATGGTGGQLVRRETATFELAKETYTTESEQTSRKQVTSNRHGPRSVNGSIRGLLSPGTYADFLSAILMRDFSAVPSVVGVSVTIAGTGPSYTVTRDAGDWLADGAKIGRGLRLGVGGLHANNLNKNLLIIGVTTTVLTVIPMNRKAMQAEGPIAGVTASFPGKVTWVPETGHTNIYYTVEEWYADVPFSQRNQDVKFTAATLRLPGSGNAGIDLTAMGLDQVNDTTAYFAAPAAETTTEVLVAASGALLVNGALQAVVTDLSITMDARGALADPVVGSNVRPDVFTGKLVGSGTFTAYFLDNTIPNLFTDEVVTSIVSALTAGNAANADFMTISMHNVKLNSSAPDDVETGLKRTYGFTATFNAAGGAALATQSTTVELHDSAA